MPWESDIERGFISAMEFSRVTSHVESQPARLIFESGDQVIDYTPDFLVLSGRYEPVIVECKPDDLLAGDELRARLTQLREMFFQIGVRFEVVTDKHLGRGAIVENTKLLMRHRRRPPSLPFHFDWKKAFGGKDSIPFEELKDNLGALGAYHSIASGELGFNFVEPLVNSTLIYQFIQENDDVANYLISR